MEIKTVTLVRHFSAKVNGLQEMRKLKLIVCRLTGYVVETFCLLNIYGNRMWRAGHDPS